MTNLTTKIRDAMIAELEKQSIERAPDGSGFWFINAWVDLDKVAAAVEAALPKSDPASANCPDCGEPQPESGRCQCWNDE